MIMAVEVEMDHFMGPKEVVAVQVVNPVDSSKLFRTLPELKSQIVQLQFNSPSAAVMSKCPKFQKALLPSDAKGSEPSGDHRKEPNFMSLGPYHRGNSKLVRGEEIKLNLAVHAFKLFLKSRVGQPVDQPSVQQIEMVVDESYNKISSKVNGLRRYYDWEGMKNYSDQEFSVMMVVDGCALLSYMIIACGVDYLEEETFHIRIEDVSRLRRDALLLENQLPYPVLLELRSMLPKFYTGCWKLLCLDFFGMMEEEEEEAYPFLPKMKKFCCGPFFAIGQIINPCIHKIINWRRGPNPDEEAGINHDEEAGINHDEESRYCHLLDMYLQNFLGPKCWHGGDKIGGIGSIEDVKEQAMASFRNMKELMAAGIRIKPSPTRYLRDISFTSNCVTACLRLPPITIDKSTKTLFLNLIAYEMTLDVEHHDFISYLRFLDSLIDHADDIKELQSAGVLQNYLGTHEEVAEFFNTVSANLESNPRTYINVKVKIRKHLKSHRNSRLKRWMTQCLDTYFGSPWTIIAWVGAALVLFFTGVQTYFSAFSR